MESKLLVVYGSKYGATEEIAEHIGKQLNQAGINTEVLEADKNLDPQPYSHIVIGSALYYGFWRKNVAKFIKKQLAALETKSVWIFVSGPVGEGDPNQMVEGVFFPKGLQPIIDRIQPKSIIAFSGKVMLERMSKLEKWLMTKMNSPIGDFRNWEDIDRWIQTIIDDLSK